MSYYDYYQPEAYVPSSDTFIEKDASNVNEHIEQMRLSATKALDGTPEDVVIVATVSAIYGLGDPQFLYDHATARGDRGDDYWTSAVFCDVWPSCNTPVTTWSFVAARTGCEAR